MSSSISARAVAVGFDTAAPLLSNVDLTLEAGKILVVLGPNGCGKSTLIKALAGRNTPMAGKISIDLESPASKQTELTDLEPRALARQIAYVAQSLIFPQHLTLTEFVALGRNPHQQWFNFYQSPKDREIVQNAIARTNLAHLADHKVASLSGGEKQRAQLALALAQTTRYVILDEPTANLDYRHQLELICILHQLKSEGLGICIVLHDLNLSLQLADKVVLLAKGGIHAQGPIDEVLTENNLQDVFGVRLVRLQDDEFKGFVFKA